MSDVPRLMRTQHPDNATLPFFASGPVMEGDDEAAESTIRRAARERRFLR